MVEKSGKPRKARAANGPGAPQERPAAGAPAAGGGRAAGGAQAASGPRTADDGRTPTGPRTADDGRTPTGPRTADDGGATAGTRTAGGKQGARRPAAAAGKAGYHHGDLRNALITAAVELAVDGGPERVVLREAARRVGVSPTAAYRHFDGQAALLHAVKVRGQVALADALEQAADQVPEAADPGESAGQRFLAIGRAYVHFAIERPGLYRSAFCRIPGSPDDSWTGTEPGTSEPQFRSFNLLSASLDDLVATGRMPARRRPAAESPAWAMVHGLADLILDGPLAQLPAAEREAVIEGSVATLLAGLVAP
ncbi:TetR/AcrR family transcriptional regulator [Streptomyces sp. NPDC018031]|uniref:TetR/AcrR family transcriptional regulator n=1 Tax=Streptomyces sp. NPDC018031 TaxID=3365033 RepID=UPI0037B6CDD5